MNILQLWHRDRSICSAVRHEEGESSRGITRQYKHINTSYMPRLFCPALSASNQLGVQCHIVSSHSMPVSPCIQNTELMLS